MSPPVQKTPVLSTKIESPKKVSNGTLPQSIQNQAVKNTPVLQTIQAPQNVQTAQNNKTQQIIQAPQNKIVQINRGPQNNQNGQNKTPQVVEAPQYVGTPQNVQTSQNVRNAPASQNVKASQNVPAPQNVQAPLNVKAPQNVSAPQNVKAPQNVSAPQNVQAPQNIQAPLNIKASQNVPAPQNVPTAQNIQAHTQNVQGLQKVQTAVTPAPELIKSKEETQKVDTGESNGVGDKIRKFERAAEDATAGRTSRPGSVRGRVRSEAQEKNSASGSNSALPENVDKTTKEDKQVFSPTAFSKWRKEDPQTPIPALKNAQKTEEKEIKPTIKFNKFPTDLPVSSSIGPRSFDRQLSGTLPSEAASPTQPTHVHRNRKEIDDDANTQFKTCKYKPKDRYSGKPSGYFSRGTEEIWMVKKKDIEEIEDRVMESFRRAGSTCRSEPIREFPTFTVGSATLGRSKRAMYARSESLDPQYAASRSQTLKRQSSVACTCGHDKKNRAKSSGSSTPVECGPPRPRSRSHGDDHSQAHVLDKYETLV